MTKPSQENLRPLLRECNELFRTCARRLRILDSLGWEGKVAAEFFKYKGTRLPKPEYKFDRQNLSEILAALDSLAPKLTGDHPVLRWLLKTLESYRQGAQLLLAIETKAFYEISSQIYGRPLSKPFKNQTTNLSLAESISQRISTATYVDIRGALNLTAEDFIAALQKRLEARVPKLPVRLELSDDIASRATAGLGRVRIRRGSRFSSFELISIFNHEVETHCLTSQNGNLQSDCEFLAFGGPRTTMTQEGLAIFFEMYGHSLSYGRFMTLCDRVHAVKKVEDGADFIELYRWYKERAPNDVEAFLMAQRIFRGARLQGKFPMTKDVVYLAGLLGIYNFLRIAVKNQNRLLVESLVCGRIALEDVGTIAWMRKRGLITAPKYVPWWLDNWETLLGYFSFSSFLINFDLNSFQAYFDELTPLSNWDFTP